MAAGGETAQSEARGGAGGGESPGTRGSPANQLGLQLHVLFDPTAHRDHGGHVQVSKPWPTYLSVALAKGSLLGPCFTAPLAEGTRQGQYIVYCEGNLKRFEYKTPFSNKITVPKLSGRSKENHEHFQSEWQRPGQDSNPAPSEYEIRAVPLRQSVEYRDDGKSKVCRNMRKASTSDEVSL
jgi:hypothetical protein